jgi:hypothetical protein
MTTEIADVREVAQLILRNVKSGAVTATWIEHYIKDYASARLDPAEQTIAELRQQLSEAAMEINCAGPVAHRIRVLKAEWQARVERLEKELRDLFIECRDHVTEPIPRCLQIALQKAEQALAPEVKP